MNCVLVTLTYPYGNGDPFLHEEMPIISEQFDHIYILPVIQEDGEGDKLPKNAELIYWEPKAFPAKLKAFLNLGRIINEIQFGRRMGYTNLPRMLHRAFMYEIRKHSYISALDQFREQDCVFYSYWLAEPAYLLSWYKKNHPDAICVSRAHGYDCFKDRGYNPFRREIAENIDHIYSISEMGREDLEKNLSHLSRNGHRPVIEVARLGVDTSNELNPAKEETDVFRIVTCSSVVSVKRLDMMAEAFKLLNNNTGKIEWIHFGGGELLDQIKEQTGHGDESENKHAVFKGPTPHEEILNYYQSTHVDLFVNCSDAEGIPVSMMEAMEYAIPCIGRNVGGISELIDDRINGFLLPTETDSKMLAEKINEIMDTGISDDMRTSAKRKIHKEYSNSDNYYQFAQELIGLKK